MTTSTDADAFLLAYHEAWAGETARVFGPGRTADGRSSYELLAALPPGDARVLDLGCGDGYLLELFRARGLGAERLVGVDMSAHELAAARARPALAGVSLLRARAQSLPVDDGAIDWVVSHLAFMLMAEPAVVLAEIARVLRAGGAFATVVGGGPVADEGFSLFLDLFRDAYAASPVKAPRFGDKRTRHADGLAELCAGLGFAAPAEEVHDVRLDGTADEVWDRVHSVYESFVLSPQAMASLRDQFVAEASSRWGDVVPCVMRVRLLTARLDR